jgi:integrase
LGRGDFVPPTSRWVHVELVPDERVEALIRSPWPKEQAPKRPVLRHEEYEALRAVAPDVHPLFTLVLLLAHETGHRIGAIRSLKWSDVDRKPG